MAMARNAYRKNFFLIGFFLILISAALVIALIVSYNFTEKTVQNEFQTRKNDIEEQTTKPYFDFFQNKIFEITSYNGFLDSASAAGYAQSVFSAYPFVQRMVFYNIAIRGENRQKRRLAIMVRSAYQYTLKKHKVISARLKNNSGETDFRLMSDKLSNYIATADTLRPPSQDDQFKTFYDVRQAKISYMNIPRPAEITNYRELARNGRPDVFYRQNMMTFVLNPYRLQVVNSHPELYQHIAVKPVVYDVLDGGSNNLYAEAAFPGAFADYKLFFSAAKAHLNGELRRRFLPTAGIVLLIYIFLLTIGWLIYRNININVKLFKLQYDFINNFTHEFKTPVSVIKIAGSNLRSENELTERQRKHYGKILDDEADKLNNLMNKLLSFTQIENRSITVKSEQIIIRDFVAQYAETFRLKYPDLRLTYNISPGVTTLTADPVLLGSIFQNLIENAYKYSHPQKKEVYIGISMDKRNIVFSFADKGIGIPKGEIANIFKKFYRIENKYNQNGSVGLGLAFCKELVNFMDGQINVKSREEEGSEFTVTLPAE